MTQLLTQVSRRRFCQGVVAASAAAAGPSFAAEPAPAQPAHIAITLDLEMSAQYPRRDMTEWNFEKGNLDEATKKYALEAGRIVKQAGGVIHYFCVGRVLEQPDVEWLKELAREGHSIGNHTYDHVNVTATRPEQTQYRFQRAPWLVRGKSAAEIIRENIRLTSEGLKTRCDIRECGFRTPGGFADGLADRPDVQELLLELGFKWVSSKYPRHSAGEPGQPPGRDVFDSILAAQQHAQPMKYGSGLVEIPMSPISDVTAFRSHRWKLASFVEAIGQAVDWAISKRACFDFLAHPSCLVVEDPEFQTIRAICERVRKQPDAARLVDLQTIYERVE